MVTVQYRTHPTPIFPTFSSLPCFRHWPVTAKCNQNLILLLSIPVSSSFLDNNRKAESSPKRRRNVITIMVLFFCSQRLQTLGPRSGYSFSLKRTSVVREEAPFIPDSEFQSSGKSILYMLVLYHCPWDSLNSCITCTFPHLLPWGCCVTFTVLFIFLSC